MKYNEKQVEELVQAAAEAMSHGQGTDALGKALENFRPKPPRVGYLYVNGGLQHDHYGVIKAIQFTPEVREALRVAGIEWEETT